MTSEFVYVPGTIMRLNQVLMGSSEINVREEINI